MISMTYGTMPTREQFDEAFEEMVCNGSRDNADGYFVFWNDPRVGDTKLTCDELWDELQEAHAEWLDKGWSPKGEEAGDWCSAVLGELGFEWI